MPEWWSRVKNTVRRRKPALSNVSRLTNQAHNLVAHAQRVHNVARHANKGTNNVSFMVYQGNVRAAAQDLAKAQQLKEGATRQLNALKRGSWTKGPLKRRSNGTVRWANAATYNELRGNIDSRGRKTLKMNNANVRMAKQLARAELLQKNLMGQLRQAAYRPASRQGNVTGIRANYESIRALANASKKQLNGVRKSGSWVGGPFVLNTKTGQPHVNWNPKNQALFNSVSGRVVRNAGNRAYLLTHTMVPRSRQQTLQSIMNKRSPLTRGNVAYLKSPNPINKINKMTRNTTARASTPWLNVYRPPTAASYPNYNNHIEPDEYSLAALGKAYPRSWSNLRRSNNGSNSGSSNNNRRMRRGAHTPKSVLSRI